MQEETPHRFFAGVQGFAGPGRFSMSSTGGHSMKRVSFRDRLRYQFDNTMSKGPIALIGWLFLLTVALIVVVSLAVVVAARRRGQVALGYRLHAEAYDPTSSHGVRLNPEKSRLVTLSEEDRIILLSED
jgi:hypothetical protein